MIAPSENDTTLYYTINQPKVIRINQELMTFQVNLEEIIYWEDSRIQNDYPTSNAEIAFRFKSLRKLPIWTPLPYLDFRDVKIWQSSNGGKIGDLWISPKNTTTQIVVVVHITIQGRATIYCDFDYTLYPLDTQICYFRIDTKKVNDFQLKFNSLNSSASEIYESCGFSITTSVMYTDGIHNMAGFDLHMERIIKPYIFQYYLPCIAIVVMSQISFIIPLSAIPGRVALVSTLFLSLTNIYINQMVNIFITILLFG